MVLDWHQGWLLNQLLTALDIPHARAVLIMHTKKILIEKQRRSQLLWRPRTRTPCFRAGKPAKFATECYVVEHHGRNQPIVVAAPTPNGDGRVINPAQWPIPIVGTTGQSLSRWTIFAFPWIAMEPVREIPGFNAAPGMPGPPVINNPVLIGRHQELGMKVVEVMRWTLLASLV